MRYALLIALVAACALVRTASAAEFVRRSDDDLVLVELRLGRDVLAESLPGYVGTGHLMLPLGQLADALQFPIKVSVKDGRAEGWFLDENNRFSLDASRREVTVGDRRESFSEGMVEVHEDDIYVDTVLLGFWFPLDFPFAFSTQSISIIPKGGVMLPIESGRERGKRHARLNARGDEPLPDLPRVQTPYALYSMPFADVTYSTGLDQRDDRGVRHNLSVLANHDLLYMHSSAYLTVNEDNLPDDLRWTLSRRDPEGKIFRETSLADNTLAQTVNRLEVRELAIGDIYTQQVPLSAFNQQGRGVLVSSKPYDQATLFDRTTLQGDLQQGWEVELYRNDQLLDFRRTSADGRYEFIDVPLLSGLNILRLVFYGPFGQTREEVRRFLVSPNVTTAGQGHFRFSASQQDMSVFDFRSEPSVALSGVPVSERDAAQGTGRVMMEYGLTSNVALFGNLVHFTTGDGVTRNYTGAGAATSILGTYARLDASHEFEDGGNAVQLSLQDNIMGVSVSAQHQQYFNYVSEFTESVTDPVISRSELRADTPIALAPLPHMNVGVSGLHVVYDSGRKRDDLSQRLTTAVDRMALSHTFTLRRDEVSSTETLHETRGELIASLPYDRFLVRGNLAYIVAPAASIDSMAITTEYHFSRDTLARLDVTRQMRAPSLTTYGVALNRRFKHFMLGASASHDDDGNNAVGITLSFGIGQDPRSGGLMATPDYVARDGLVVARTFEDANANGRFDDGEKEVKDARYRVNRGSAQGIGGDEDAGMLLYNIPANTRMPITLDTASIDSPYLAAPVPGADIVARSGVPTFIDIAMLATADVEGTAYVGSDRKPASNVAIQAVDGSGKVVRETRTAFDGYYLLEMLPVGSYRLRVSPEQAGRLGLSGSEIPVEITGARDIVGGMDFTLQKK
jgi:hypothetical protein